MEKRAMLRYNNTVAEVAKLVDAHGLGPCSERIVGSIPSFGTNRKKNVFIFK